MHWRVSVDGDGLQLHIGRRPNPFAHDPHDRQQLPRDIQMERIDESPERGLHRQTGDFQDARNNRIASDKAQLVQPSKADVQAQQNAQQESVQVQGAGDSL